MIAIWRLLPIAYRKAKVRLQKEEERDRRTHFLQIQRGSKSQYTKKNTVRECYRGRDISGYGKQAGETHSHPGKNKREVVRTQKEGNQQEHSLSGEVRD